MRIYLIVLTHPAIVLFICLLAHCLSAPLKRDPCQGRNNVCLVHLVYPASYLARSQDPLVFGKGKKPDEQQTRSSLLINYSVPHLHVSERFSNP